MVWHLWSFPFYSVCQNSLILASDFMALGLPLVGYSHGICLNFKAWYASPDSCENSDNALEEASQVVSWP